MRSGGPRSARCFSIPVYWIVNLIDCQLEVSSSSPGGAHPLATILGENDFVDLVIAGQLFCQIAVANLLPKRP